MKSSLLIIILLLTAACDLGATDLRARRNKGNNKTDDDSAEATSAPEAPKCNEANGVSYTGFGGSKLDATRANVAAGADRARVKPYAALRAEYERAIGVVPQGIDQEAASFGASPERYTVEPKANALQLYSAFRLAFNGCLSHVATVSELSKAPTEETAAERCTEMARKFWHRAPTEAEVDACTKVALEDTVQETEPARRWAYTCASLMSSAGFLTY